MAKRRQRRGKPLPTEPVTVKIESLSHEGRGVGRIDGKTVFVDGALPDETVQMKYTFQRSKFDEGQCLSVENPHTDRVTPPCQHFGVCGGCSMQHLSTDAQITHKQSILKEQFSHFANTQPDEWLPPLQADLVSYRRKARLGVRYVAKKQKTLIGFREKYSNFLADIDYCEILVKEVADLLAPMSQLIDGLDTRLHIPQIEVACGDKSVCLIVRHLHPLTTKDLTAWVEFAQQHELIVYLQPKGPKTVHRIWPLDDEDGRLSYRLEHFGLEMLVEPLDFTQVNASINQKMIPMALDLLEINSDDNLLDLFCGLGNFTLPMATKAKHVVGVEGVQEMVDRGTHNANHNNLDNVEFYQADLAGDLSKVPWLDRTYNKVLIDPARSGAIEVIANIVKLNPEKIVYVSCNPSTLARDTGELVRAGYRLTKAGVMDMFPHTTHVESIALFEK
ncbi:MAG: 23S rRNA (uracil(1939)-C(5))-methyltransferase RlmD [Kangiellaceae bacterium]|nr:23S rRNA (uracil(1939)-C(5))-methyltransferase RlmD [Kangiellaceae bacterium]